MISTTGIQKMRLFCDDNHGEFDHLIEAVKQHHPAALILLDGIQAQRPLEVELAPVLDKTEVWFIHGNHGTDTEADDDNLFGSKLADRNLHGRMVDIAGVRVTGLGGVFRKQVWMPSEGGGGVTEKQFLRSMGRGNRWRYGMPLRHRSTIFLDVYESLAKSGANIMVTHEAGSAHPHGFAVIDQLARSPKVSKNLHCHHHDSLDYRSEWYRLGREAYGLGFCGITRLDGTVIRVGHYDNLRKCRADYGP